MTCFLCHNAISKEGEPHLCVKDNTALFRQRKVEVSPTEFSEYTDALDFFDAVQVIDEEEVRHVRREA